MAMPEHLAILPSFCIGWNCSPNAGILFHKVEVVTESSEGV